MFCRLSFLKASRHGPMDQGIIYIFITQGNKHCGNGIQYFFLSCVFGSTAFIMMHKTSLGIFLYRSYRFMELVNEIMCRHSTITTLRPNWAIFGSGNDLNYIYCRSHHRDGKLSDILVSKSLPTSTEDCLSPYLPHGMQSFGLNKKREFVRKGEHQIVSQGTRFGMGKILIRCR